MLAGIVARIWMPIHPGQDRSVERLLTAISRGEYAIPYFQRGFEWQPNMVKDLLVSIISGYFTGLLLFWELEGDSSRQEQWEPIQGAKIGQRVYFAVLDGQQRLSSLFFALHNPNQHFPNRKSYYLFNVDLEKYLAGNYEECILYTIHSNYMAADDLKSDRKAYVNELIFPLALLSDDGFVKNEYSEWVKDYAEVLADRRFGGDKTNHVPERYQFILDTREELNRLKGNILGYEFATHVLTRDKDIKDVCLIFAKLNQKGLKLSTFDLMNAFLYPHGVRLRKSYEALDDKLASVQDMDELLLKTMALKTQDYCSPKYVFSLVPGVRTIQKTDGHRREVVVVADGEAFSGMWESACKYCERARKRIMNLGIRDFGSVKVDFIPNTTTIPVVAAIYWLRDEVAGPVNSHFDEILSKWYWSAVFSKEYSGSSDSVISEDFRAFRRLVVGGVPLEKLDETKLDSIANTLDFSEEKKGTSVYNAVISIIALKGALDFYELRPPGSGDYIEASVNDHHIFPSKVRGLDPSKSKRFGETKDTVVNRTLLLDETNTSMGNSRPSLYLKEVENRLATRKTTLEGLMAAHLISSEALGCMWQDDYDGFIACRQKTMNNEVRERLGLPPVVA